MGEEATTDTVTTEGGPQGGPATPPPAPAPAPGDDYRKRFSELVSKFDTLKAQKGYEKWEDVPALSQVQAWQQSHGQLAEIQNKVTTLSGELEITRGEATGLKAWQAKVKAILEVDPSLIEFVDDITTVAEAEQQKAQIQAFAHKLAKRAGPNQGRSGMSPVPPSSTIVSTGDTGDAVDLYARMTQAIQAARHDPSKRDEATRLREQWYALQNG